MSNIAVFTFDEYQQRAHQTAFYPSIVIVQAPPSDVVELATTFRIKTDVSWAYATIGLSGEVGELLNYLKKIIRDRNGVVTEEDKSHIIGELGGVLWYVAELATAFGLSLEEIAQFNLGQLASRAERGTLSGSGDNR